MTIALDDESRQPSPVSPMPVGLLNTLTEEEIRCLLAYLESDQRSSGGERRPCRCGLIAQTHRATAAGVRAKETTHTLAAGGRFP